MKLLTIASILLSASTLFAIDLQQATNEQILGELRYRLSNGSSNSGSAIADYSCSGQYLFVTLTGTAGTNNQENVYISGNPSCKEQAKILNEKKSKINTVVVAAICNSNYLYRKVLKPTGEFGNTTEQYMQSEADCIAQAKLINGE